MASAVNLKSSHVRRKRVQELQIQNGATIMTLTTPAFIAKLASDVRANFGIPQPVARMSVAICGMPAPDVPRMSLRSSGLR